MCIKGGQRLTEIFCWKEGLSDKEQRGNSARFPEVNSQAGGCRTAAMPKFLRQALAFVGSSMSKPGLRSLSLVPGRCGEVKRRNILSLLSKVNEGINAPYLTFSSLGRGGVWRLSRRKEKGTLLTSLPHQHFHKQQTYCFPLATTPSLFSHDTRVRFQSFGWSLWLMNDVLLLKAGNSCQNEKYLPAWR